MKRLLIAGLLLLAAQSRVEAQTYAAGNGGFSLPALTTNCVLAATSSGNLTCTLSPTINGTNFVAGSIPNSALASSPVTSVGGTSPIASSGGATPTISLGTVGVANGGTGLTSYAVGDIPYASGTTAISSLADVATGSVLRSGGVGAAPVWTSAPAMSGANLTSGTVPNAALVTAPVTNVTASGNLSSSGGTTPAVTMTASPTFTNTLTAQGCVGTVCATGVGANDLSVANGTGAKIWLGSGGTNFLNLSGTTLQVGGGNLSMLSGNSVTSGNSTFSGSTVTSGGNVQARLSSVTSYVPPTYTAAGTAVASTMHCLSDSVTASGVATTVSLTAPTVFASANYFLGIEDDTGLSSVLPTAQSASSFTFTSINGHVYAFLACSP